MKAWQTLILSLALNGILAATLLTWRQQSQPQVAPISAPAAEPIAFAMHTNAPAVPEVAAPPPSPFPWRMIESDDYRQYMENLRAVGCPERLIREIILADIDDLYTAKLHVPQSELPPWQVAARRRAAREGLARIEVVLAEKRSVIKELLGCDCDSRLGDLWQHDSIISLLEGFLTDTQVGQFSALCERYNQQANVLREQSNNILIEEDRARLRTLYDARVAEMSKLLSPLELEELELRFRALELAGVSVFLEGVNLTGGEFREIARASKALKVAVSFDLPDDYDMPEAERASRQARFEEQLKTLLGPQRFAEFQRAQDANFRETYEFAQGRNLPGTAAVGVYEARRTAEDEAIEVRKDASLSNEEKTAALALLKATTNKTLAARLGGAYQEYLEGPGQWLEQLTELPDAGGVTP